MIVLFVPRLLPTDLTQLVSLVITMPGECCRIEVRWKYFWKQTSISVYQSGSKIIRVTSSQGGHTEYLSVVLSAMRGKFSRALDENAKHT